jgi:hypothetical protein
MAILRFLAAAVLLVAVIALVQDGTRTMASQGVVTTSVGEYWARTAPSSHKAAQGAVQRYSHPIVWDVLISAILRVPGWMLLGALGALLAFAGRRRRRINIYAN